MESKLERIVGYVFGIVGVIILAWVLISWIEVGSRSSLDTNYQYWSGNFFLKLMELAETVR